MWAPHDAAKHITFKELKVVQVALEAIGATLRHKKVALFSDSASSVAILKGLYTRSVSLRGTLGKIIALVNKYHVDLEPHHIAGELNVLAD